MSLHKDILRLLLLYSKESVCTNQYTFLIYVYVLSSMNIIFMPLLKIIPMASMIDEICVLLLAIYSFYKIRFYKNIEIVICFSILGLYLIYSLLLHVNRPIAAIYDFIITLKPFVCFYVASTLTLRVNERLKEKLKYLYIVFGLYCLAISPFISYIYSNTAAFYPACILCSVSYLFFSERKKSDWIIALFMLTPGLLSIRAKFFTEYVLFVYVAFFLKERIRVNIKWILITSILAVVTICISWEKFYMYFIAGVEEGMARTMFYVNGVNVLKDYTLFGSGFGTYATEAAAKFYSPLYVKYGLDSIWGLREIDYNTDSNFLTDTFYPALTQYGVFGICLYFFFWYRRWKAGMSLNKESYKIFVFLFIVEFVQNIADNSFTGPFGVPCMMILGFLICEHKTILKNRIHILCIIKGLSNKIYDKDKG